MTTRLGQQRIAAGALWILSIGFLIAGSFRGNDHQLAHSNWGLFFGMAAVTLTTWLARERTAAKVSRRTSNEIATAVGRAVGITMAKHNAVQRSDLAEDRPAERDELESGGRPDWVKSEVQP